MRKWWILFILLGLCPSLELLAQYPGSTRQPYDPGAQSNIQEDTIQRPALALLAYDVNRMKMTTVTIDTSVQSVHLTEGYYNRELLAGHLGTETSAQYNIPFQLDYQGLTLGADLYPTTISSELSNIITTNRTYWSAHYSTGQDIRRTSQEVGSAKAEDFGMRFYTSFARKISLNFNYQSHVDAGSVAEQALSYKRLNIALLQQDKNGRRSTYMIYDNPRITEGLSRSVSTESATMFRQDRKIVIGNTIQFQDTSGVNKSKWNARLSFINDNYSVEDFSIVTSERDLYPYSLLDTQLIDTMLLLNGVSHIKLENELVLSKGDSELSGGIVLTRSSWNQADSSYSLFPVLLKGRYAIQLSSDRAVTARARLGLIDASGDVSLALNYNSKLLGGELDLALHAEQLLPSLAQRRLVIGDEDGLKQNYNFNSIKRVGAELHYSYPRLSANIGLTYDQYSNLILPVSGVWIQPEESTNIFQVRVKKGLKLGPIHTEHQFVFQKWNNDRILQPEWMYQGKLYFGFKLFKKRMQTRWGIDAYVIPPFETPTFWPALGAFGPGIQNRTDYNFLINPYLNIKVDQFFLFVKATNAINLFQPRESSWVSGYNNYPDRIKFGLKWTLLD